MTDHAELIERLRIASDVDSNCDVGSAKFYFRQASDALAALVVERDALAAEVARMREALSSAIGYMMNARIDLETGCTKATAIKTISGGIERARAALAQGGEK